MNALRRPLAACMAAVAFATLAPGHAADAWPTKPVRLVVAFPAGAPGDIVSRLMQPALQKALGQPVVVDNKPGAGGNIGMQEVARATDGHTVLVGPDTMLTINPHLYRKLAIRPMEDLVPVTQLAAFSQELVCFPGAGIKTLPELLAAARAKPMSYASGGPGVPGHMAMEMLLADAGVQMQHVPYRGPSPAMQDVMGGMVPCGFLASPTVGPIIRDGKLVAIAVSGSKRLGSQPTVPTVAQAGIQGYDASFAEMMAMPRATPPAVVARLQAEVAKALAAPELRERLATMDLEVVANTPEEAARRLRAEHQRWGQVAARVQLQLD
ncbi:tripartite-type tricarboxylate transporter receptor subunit TctC [Variovorax boronicumulans]|uniref:Bug family tripartite tricarboxylate transporter substrate binding protein n=1 Tax=Variovorax boronicumulans TaxID=436515 RepID=UPI002788EBAE|nr:tripartite tricarboxylate transporter substrate-binding protein [Variovorax boronicumulans]MDP9910177.1 tripartite-type tricarboxylate transporter receptor subunit TctC [Variovorax boronicumulans]